MLRREGWLVSLLDGNIVRYDTIWIRDYGRAGVSLRGAMSELSEGKRRKGYKKKRKEKRRAYVVTPQRIRTTEDNPTLFFRKKKKSKKTQTTAKGKENNDIR